jgi:hypothetical protein
MLKAQSNYLKVNDTRRILFNQKNTVLKHPILQYFSREKPYSENGGEENYDSN